MRSGDKSLDKSGGSDIKMSSSNMQTSLMESKRSEMTDNSSEVDKQAEKEKKKKNKGLTDKDLELLHGINLTETETTIYFFLPSAIVQQDTPVYSETVERNKKIRLIAQAEARKR